jgi:hypothetical protein
MANSIVNWYGSRVKLLVAEAQAEILDRLAFEIEGQAKVNIRDNGQIDTGFMVNSGYTVSAKRNGYSEALVEASARNPDATMAPQVQLKRGEAAVVFGAEYSIFQEMRQSFLYKALVDVAQRSGAVILAVGRRKFR